MKKLQNIKWISKWIIQNRHQEWLDRHQEKDIDWKATWSSIQPSKISASNTSFKDQLQRTKRYKITNEELPTKERLHQRRPDIYYDN